MDANAMIEHSDISDGERALLAREAAADSYRAGGYVYDERQIHAAFSAGWDAAVEWLREQSDPRGEEELGYPHFRDGGMPLG